MRLIDEQYLRTFYGYLKMTEYLRQKKKYQVNPKRVYRPEIFNTDQGFQFTARAFTARLEQAEIKISMDGKGRVFDNIFIERLWRTVKYENIYLSDYITGLELVAGLANYFDFYNHERFHQSLDYRTGV